MELLEPIFDNFPEDLKAFPQWVAWKAVPNTDQQGNSKIDKVPIDPKTGAHAKAGNPGTWGTFDQAREWYELNRGKPHGEGRVAGVGFELHKDDPFSGVDLDKCKNGIPGLEPWAAELIEALKTYTEISPSGTGIRAIARGKLPPGRRKEGKIEMYDSGRFLTITGHILRPDLARIEDRVEELRAVHAKAFQNRKKASNSASQSANDERVNVDELFILKHAPQAKNGARFKALWKGDFSAYPSQSEADQALCNMLAFWTRKHAAMMDSLFRQSGLMREKWDKVHRPEDGSTYGRMTIERAIRDCREVFKLRDPEGAKPREKKPESACKTVDGYPLNEDGLALAFADRHKDDLKFCHHTGAWFQWDGGRWVREETNLAFNWCRDICRELTGGDSKGMSRAAAAAAVERYARADRRFAVTSSIWDQEPWVLGTPGGVVDLRTGKIYPSEQTDFITKQTSVAPAARADAPLWFRFLDEATRGDKDLQRFLQQMAGYSLTGDIREHALFFIHGDGGNGKSVFLNTVVNILADYATTAAMDTFTASKNDRHPADLAMLKGARLVSASETEEGRAWAESRIRQITGGDPITARFMRQDFFTFKPQFKLVIIGNHAPVLKNVDAAARRRFNIIPFVHKPEKPDQQLEHRLVPFYPAILRWMIEGALDWQANGLVRPPVVIEATQSYFEDQDLFGQWLEECCVTGRSEWGVTSKLYASWKEYAERGGEQPGSVKAFNANMIKRGFLAERDRIQRFFRGISLKPQGEERKPYAD